MIPQILKYWILWRYRMILEKPDAWDCMSPYFHIWFYSITGFITFEPPQTAEVTMRRVSPKGKAGVDLTTTTANRINRAAWCKKALKTRQNMPPCFARFVAERCVTTAIHTIAGNWWICWWNVPCCNEGKGKSWLLLPCLFLSHG